MNNIASSSLHRRRYYRRVILFLLDGNDCYRCFWLTLVSTSTTNYRYPPSNQSSDWENMEWQSLDTAVVGTVHMAEHTHRLRQPPTAACFFIWYSRSRKCMYDGTKNIFRSAREPRAVVEIENDDGTAVQ